MFAFTGLNKDMVNELREKYAIYMTMDGRISIAELNSGNLDYVAEGFHAVTTGKSFWVFRYESENSQKFQKRKVNLKVNQAQSTLVAPLFK